MSFIQLMAFKHLIHLSFLQESQAERLVKRVNRGE
jgi:hypothetical protein